MDTKKNEPIHNNEITSIRQRVEQYLRALGLPDLLVQNLADQAMEKTSTLSDHLSQEDRLSLTLDELLVLLKQNGQSAKDQIEALITSDAMPPIKRASMAYQKKVPASRANYRRPWIKALIFRRFLLYLLTVTSAVVGGYMMLAIFIPDGITKLEIIIIAVYTILFSWIALNFWAVLLGFLIVLFRRDHWRLYVPANDGEFKISPSVRVAVIIPVYNEEVSRVYAGIQTIFESLEKTGQSKPFDFFILSDSTEASKLVEERAAWAELCRNVHGFGKIFYRHRKNRIHKKSGNVSDFCRRWGQQYTYLIPLDADSLMSGGLLVQLVQAIEIRPDIGIIQTAPRGINQKSLLSRMNQFISHLHGPLSVTGMHFWQLDDASFWGHNAIVRLEPFIKYCALPNFGGKPPFGGEILSHDFVEAALMRRAGYGVWLNCELSDSYEELPPNLLTEFERDLRWCRGNLQHLRFLGMKGISFGHRVLFLIGNMFYFSSFLWFLSLLLITAYAIFDAFKTPVYFTDQPSLFPDWPVRNWGVSFWLASFTGLFLFFPKILSLLWLIFSPRKMRQFGGFFRLTLSILLETIFSILLAPIRMLFHSRFIVLAFLGKKIDWKKQNRYATKSGILESLQAHWISILVGLILAGVTYVVNPSLFLWLLTIVVPLIISVPFSIFLSYEKSGMLFKKWKLFLSPVETNPPWELERFIQLAHPVDKKPLFSNHHGYDFIGAVADPKINALSIKCLERRPGVTRPSRKKALINAQDILENNPHQMKASEMRKILNDPNLLADLHHKLWRSTDGNLSKPWRMVFKSLSQKN